MSLRVICYILIFIYFSQYVASLLNLNYYVIYDTKKLMAYIAIFYAIANICHGASKLYTNRQRREFVFEPITITFTHDFIRIPLEDIVDLEIGDRHNVHNKTVKRTAVMAIKELEKSDSKTYSIESAIDSIRDHLKIGGSENALRALKNINDIDGYYNTAKLPEREILRLVWERINHPININQIDQLKANLAEQLADCCNGNTGVHCCEGRITRILQSLQHCDQENIVNLRPMWAFKDEITDKIPRYREKLLKKLPSKYNFDEKNDIDITDNDRKLINQFNSCLIKNLNERFYRDYVETGYLNKNELNELTKVYYESLYDY